jgi:hypothetical protein
MRYRGVLAMLCIAFLLAGCAELREDVRQIRELINAIRGMEPAPPAPSPPPADQIPAPAAAGLTLYASCVGKDESGYAESLKMDMAGGVVRTLDARIDIPKRGSCSYRLSDFRQTRQTPYIELRALSSSACAIRVWQQGDRVTVAATDCEERCSRGAFEYSWPVQLRAPGGGCY